MRRSQRVVARLAGAAVRWRRGALRDPRAVRRILVCATGGVGNTILLLPLLRVLRRALPGAALDLLLTNRTAARLAEDCGWADAVLCVEERQWYVGFAPIRLFLDLRSRRYDICLRTFLTAPEMLRASLAAGMSGAPIRVAYGTPDSNPFETHLLPPDESVAEIDRHLALAAAIGLEAAPEVGRFSAPTRGSDWARRYLAGVAGAERSLLGIHPGSDAGFEAKRWPAHRFGEVAALAGSRLGARVVFVGGPEDREAIEVARRVAGPGALVAVGQDIVETAGLVERCAAFVSNDSGLMHLASAMGVPTLAIFGPTDPVKNRALDPATVVLRLGLDCSPCARSMATRLCINRPCLADLGTGAVMRLLEPLLAAGERGGTRSAAVDTGVGGGA